MKNPLREICTAGSVRRDPVGEPMVNLNGHEAGNGGHSQRTPKAHRGTPLLGKLISNQGPTDTGRRRQPRRRCFEWTKRSWRKDPHH